MIILVKCLIWGRSFDQYPPLHLKLFKKKINLLNIVQGFVTNIYFFLVVFLKFTIDYFAGYCDVEWLWNGGERTRQAGETLSTTDLRYNPLATQQ